MSEQGPQFDPSVQLPVMVDPAVRRSLDQAKVFQQELDDPANLPIPLARVKEMIETLDNECLHYNEHVFVSGRVRSPVIHVIEDASSDNGETQSAITTITEEDGTRQAMCSYFSNDVEYTSKGFLIDDEPLMVGGYEIGRHYMLRLLLSRTVYVYVPESQTPRAVDLKVMAAPDAVVMEFTHDSFEYNELKARAYFPDFMKDVDASIKDAKRIADKIFALRGLEAALTHHISENEVLAVEAYLDEMVNPLEDDIPFLVALQKGALYFDPDQKDVPYEELDEDCVQMINIHNIRVVTKMDVSKTAGPYVVTTYPDTLELRIAGQVRGTDIEEDSQQVEIRLRDIQSITSVRQSVFEAEDVEDD